MKKYGITLLLLIAIGLALTVQMFTQGSNLDQTVFSQTTKSIRSLQSLDKNISLQLHQSRFNTTFDHGQLTELNYQLSEEFDNLRFDALFEEIENSPALSEAVDLFETQYLIRDDALESYIKANSTISDGLNLISEITSKLQHVDLGEHHRLIQGLLSDVTATIYRLRLSGKLNDSSSRRLQGGLLDKVSQMQFDAPTAISKSLSELKAATEAIISNHPLAIESYQQLITLKTSQQLDDIENEYTLFHNHAIADSKRFRNALIIYGLTLLAALFFFAWQIRKSYTSLEQQVADRTADIENAYTELQESQEQLIQSEKMASLGQMVAGVAHEINTPLGYVNSNIETLSLNFTDLSEVMNELGSLAELIQQPVKDNTAITKQLVSTVKHYLTLDTPEIINESDQLLKDGEYGLKEISKLVSSLKDFARLDRQSTEKVNINSCIENSLTIASNHIRQNNVSVDKNLADLPSASCYPSKLNQLFLNIITNACQAMEETGGTLTITSAHVSGELLISFQDEGIGMDQNTQQQMFDPFFTTKDIGEGTGLGLSIAYKIVDVHQGTIWVESNLGSGTTITISLPI